MTGPLRTAIGVLPPLLGGLSYSFFRIPQENYMSGGEALAVLGTIIVMSVAGGILAYYLPTIVNRIRHRNSYPLATI